MRLFGSKNKKANPVAVPSSVSSNYNEQDQSPVEVEIPPALDFSASNTDKVLNGTQRVLTLLKAVATGSGIAPLKAIAELACTIVKEVQDVREISDQLREIIVEISACIIGVSAVVSPAMQTSTDPAILDHIESIKELTTSLHEIQEICRKIIKQPDIATTLLCDPRTCANLTKIQGKIHSAYRRFFAKNKTIMLQFLMEWKLKNDNEMTVLLDKLENLKAPDPSPNTTLSEAGGNITFTDNIFSAAGHDGQIGNTYANASEGNVQVPLPVGGNIIFSGNSGVGGKGQIGNNYGTNQTFNPTTNHNSYGSNYHGSHNVNSATGSNNTITNGQTVHHIVYGGGRKKWGRLMVRQI